MLGSFNLNGSVERGTAPTHPDEIKDQFGYPSDHE
jgi:hypothetical protein